MIQAISHNIPVILLPSMYVGYLKMRQNLLHLHWVMLLCVLVESSQAQQTCCRLVMLASGGPAAHLQADRLGLYRISGLLNQRPVYKHHRNRGAIVLSW